MFFDLETKFNNLPIKTKQFRNPIVIRILDDTHFTITDLLDGVKQIFPKNNIILIEDSICVIVSSNKTLSTGLNFPQINEFKELLKYYGAYAIEGNTSQINKTLSIMFNECYQVLPIAVAVRYGKEADERVFELKRYLFYYTIFLAEQSMNDNFGENDALFIVDPAVLMITRYDRTFGSNLRDYLYNFLLHDCNISKTAQNMFAHRNTVVYKIGQIKEIIGTDWVNNPNTKHILLFSCMVLRYVENYKKEYIHLKAIEKTLLKNKLDENLNENDQ